MTEAGSGDSQVYREVYALYEQLLGRDPDPAGFAFWTGSGGAGLGQMADSFLTSPEAFNSDFVVMAAYQAATGAPPTFAQFTAAVTAIRAGTQTVAGLFNSLTARRLHRHHAVPEPAEPRAHRGGNQQRQLRPAWPRGSRPSSATPPTPRRSARPTTSFKAPGPSTPLRPTTPTACTCGCCTT